MMTLANIRKKDGQMRIKQKFKQRVEGWKIEFDWYQLTRAIEFFFAVTTIWVLIANLFIGDALVVETSELVTLAFCNRNRQLTI